MKCIILLFLVAFSHALYLPYSNLGAQRLIRVNGDNRIFIQDNDKLIVFNVSNDDPTCIDIFVKDRAGMIRVIKINNNKEVIKQISLIPGSDFHGYFENNGDIATIHNVKNVQMETLVYIFRKYSGLIGEERFFQLLKEVKESVELHQLHPIIYDIIRELEVQVIHFGRYDVHHTTLASTSPKNKDLLMDETTIHHQHEHHDQDGHHDQHQQHDQNVHNNNQHQQHDQNVHHDDQHQQHDQEEHHDQLEHHDRNEHHAQHQEYDEHHDQHHQHDQHQHDNRDERDQRDNRDTQRSDDNLGSNAKFGGEVLQAVRQIEWIQNQIKNEPDQELKHTHNILNNRHDSTEHFKEYLQPTTDHITHKEGEIKEMVYQTNIEELQRQIAQKQWRLQQLQVQKRFLIVQQQELRMHQITGGNQGLFPAEMQLVHDAYHKVQQQLQRLVEEEIFVEKRIHDLQKELIRQHEHLRDDLRKEQGRE